MEILYPSNFNASYTFIYYSKVTLYVFIKLHFENTWPTYYSPTLLILYLILSFPCIMDSIKILNDYCDIHFHYHYQNGGANGGANG